MAARPSTGVIGLGIIGSRVAARLAAEGFEPAVWNRTPRVIPGLPPAAPDPASVAHVADVIQIFVSDDNALRSTVEMLRPALGPRHIVLAHATVAPKTMREAAAAVSVHGASFLDAPFTGSRDAAARGQITYYIGGDDAVLERIRPVLAVSAKAIIPLGDIGTASAVKIATNIMAAAAATSLAEAVNLLRANGVNPEVLPRVLENNAARSGVTDLKLPCMLAHEFSPSFSTKNMLKDIRLALELAKPGASTLTASIEQLYTLACQQGLGEEDFAAVVKAKAPMPETKQ